jgi:ubiquinone/menaquinone biosynthesis C-methylase UbiE
MLKYNVYFILHHGIQNMSKIYTTEITSDSIASDNPIHQRLLKAYVVAQSYIQGDILEVGCGEGRGIELVIGAAKSYTAIDKIASAIEALRKKFPQGKFISGNIPPLKDFPDNSFDRVLSFQVIEHLEDDRLFLKEIHRVLKPGGQALLTTPNRSRSLSRNPWHIREYTGTELSDLARTIFAGVEMKGISGNEKVMQYYDRNRKAVEKITRFDFLNLQHRLPAAILRIPYELLNRWNRNNLKTTSDDLVMSIRHEDYMVVDDASGALDLLLIAAKAHEER